MKWFQSIAAFSLLLMVPSIRMVYSEEDATAIDNGSIVYPGDTVVFPEDTSSAELRAVWGVRVIVTDDTGHELLNTVTEVNDNIRGVVELPEITAPDGYRFSNWTVDRNPESASVSEDNRTVSVKGPGPVYVTAHFMQSVNDAIAVTDTEDEIPSGKEINPAPAPFTAPDIYKPYDSQTMPELLPLTAVYPGLS